MALLILVIIFGGIVVTMAVDIWTTTSDKTPATYKNGAFSGEYNPEDIRGSYTFEEVSTLFDIDLQVLYQAFEISETTNGSEIQTKDLEALYGDIGVEVGNESVQVFVALYKNLPINLGDTYLPKQAVDLILKVNTELTDEQLTYLEDHQVELKKSDTIIEETDNPEPNNDQEALDASKEATEEKLVTGSTTFQQVIDAGITKEQIENIIGKALPPTNQSVKDYCSSEGLSFSTIKDELNRLKQ